jgi:hypothetical protein
VYFQIFKQKNTFIMAPSATNTNGSSTTSGKLQFDTFQNVINGKLVGSAKSRNGINPATKKALPEVPIATEKDVEDAVAAAREAFKSWSKTSVAERKKALNDFSAEFASYKEQFAKLLTQEQGKPVSSDNLRFYTRTPTYLQLGGIHDIRMFTPTNYKTNPLFFSIFRHT